MDNRSETQKHIDRAKIRIGDHTLDDYWIANARRGPLADVFVNKPWRLLYDLIQHIEQITPHE